MMRWNPHLTFNGQCEAAFKFYEKCLGGTIVMMLSYGDSPMAEQTPPDWRNKILHATFALGDQIITGGDVQPASYQKPQGFSLLLNVAAADEAEGVFEILAENGVVQMTVQETFWALRFGMLVDQFGTPWMINCGSRPDALGDVGS
jgi:PhnB protein